MHARIAPSSIETIAAPADGPAPLYPLQDFVRQRFRGVDVVPNLAGTCMQTNVPDNNFVLDFVPGTDKKVCDLI